MTEKIRISAIIPDELGNTRLDQVAAQLFPEFSRSRLQAWIKSGELTVNDTALRPKDKVMGGQQLRVEVEPEAEGEWQPQDIDFGKVFEDEHILVIDKPAGLVVHPAAGHADGTLVNALLNHCPSLAQLPRAGIVHRLDKDTSGLMVVAKSLEAHHSLVKQLQARTVHREYEAVVFGELTGGGTVEAAIGRHPQQRQKMAVVRSGGKEAITHYRLLKRYRGFSHIRCLLETGRTHQIRVHMAHIHFPLVGDPLYAGRLRLPKACPQALVGCISGFGRQALHARKLQLLHPVSAVQMRWQSQLPGDLRELLAMLDLEAAAE